MTIKVQKDVGQSASNSFSGVGLPQNELELHEIPPALSVSDISHRSPPRPSAGEGRGQTPLKVTTIQSMIGGRWLLTAKAGDHWFEVFQKKQKPKRALPP